jgi:16S rRNA (cytidine1402-2'-O)-methyltransferase
MGEAGRLSVVGTPIGNLEDISPRAVRSLREADVVYCEDTRRARKLLSALGLPAPRLVRLDRHNEFRMVPVVVAAIESGAKAVLVSDAGMPTISDPGDVLVRGVAEAGYPPEVIPGPCAVSAALALSGLPAPRYHFAGFLPRKGKDRAAALAELAA